MERLNHILRLSLSLARNVWQAMSAFAFEGRVARFFGEARIFSGSLSFAPVALPACAYGDPGRGGGGYYGLFSNTRPISGSSFRVFFPSFAAIVSPIAPANSFSRLPLFSFHIKAQELVNPAGSYLVPLNNKGLLGKKGKTNK